MDSDRGVARLAVAVGAVALVSVSSLALFFIVGKPFGAINDWTIGIVGILSGLLALALNRSGEFAAPQVGSAATGVAVAGAVIVIVGSALVISETTGFLLAGLVESMGFALIGLWLIAFNRSIAFAPWVPARLPNLGIAAGIIMAIWFTVLPGVLIGVEDMEAAPAWFWIGFVGWLGIFFLYPIWSIWFGAALRQERGP
jgi:hypothetical protein